MDGAMTADKATAVGSIGEASDSSTYARDVLTKTTEQAKIRIGELDEIIGHRESELVTLKQERAAHASFLDSVAGAPDSVGA